MQKKQSEKFSFELKHYGLQDVKKETVYKPNDYAAIYFGLALHYAFEIEDFDAVLNKYGIFTDVQKAYTMYEKGKKLLLTQTQVLCGISFDFKISVGLLQNLHNHLCTKCSSLSGIQ